MYKGAMKFNISLLIGLIFSMGCSSNNSESHKKDYSLKYSELEVEKTLIRNILALNNLNDNQVILKETHFFTDCSCEKKGNNLKIIFKKKIGDNVEKRVTVIIRDRIVKDVEVRHIINQKEGNGRVYKADSLVLSLDTSNNSLLTGKIDFSSIKKEAVQIMTDSFEGNFICDNQL